MLTIHMPEDKQENRRRRRWQALGYLIAGGLIITTTFFAYGTPWWYLPLIVEAWWLWAVYSLDWEK